MLYEVDEQTRNQSKTPHEVFVFNLIVFHLLLTPAAIALGIGPIALLLPVLFSTMVIAFIYVRGKKAETASPWFVMAHWKLALTRCKLLVIAYGISAAIIGGGWLLTLGADKSTQHIMFTVLTRIGVMPVVIMVFVTFVIESGAINQAVRGEVPDHIVRRFPAPSSVTALQQAD